MIMPLKVWGNPSLRSAFTIDLFPIGDAYRQTPIQSVLIYAKSFEEALVIAIREGLSLNLEPRQANSQRVN